MRFWPGSSRRLNMPFVPSITANVGTEPAGGGLDRPQQTPLHYAGAEGGAAREEPAEGSAHGGSGGASTVQEVTSVKSESA